MIVKKIVYAVLVPVMFSCANKPYAPPALIPAPVELTMHGDAGMKRCDLESVWTPDSALGNVCRAFADDVPGMRTVPGRNDAAVKVYLCDTMSVPGGYRLDVLPDSIVVRVADAGGAANGLSTLRQLLMTCPDRLPSLRISDYPRFGYRGVI